jgi:LuxR family transcriptional regulator, maltose regulon positive regulatory protein
VHVVIATRADPALPLARLRGRGDLVEIRAADLRFTPEEATAYLTEFMGLTLTERDVAALERRTEGWVAALQLAALSMQAREDLGGFIAGFAGDDRYIVDFLTEEVLQRLPEAPRQFLLRTSILDRLCGRLCDAVTGQADGKATLAALERANLFVFPLDERRQWYRYHQLFADLLRTHLLDDHSDDVALLHERASAWYDRNDEPTDAVRHAVAAGDYERAAELMELAIPALRRCRQEAVIRSWVDVLPGEVLKVRPVLSLGLAGGSAASGELDEVDRLLRHAERWVATITGAPEGSATDDAEMVVIDQEELRSLPGEIEMYRAAQALVRGDALGAREHARQAIELAPEGDSLPRAGGTAFLGLASWAGGDLEAAEAAYADSMVMLQRAGHDADVLGCALALADIQVAQGRLGEAMRTYERGLAHGERDDGRILRGTADMHVGLSELHRERDDLPAAREQLRRGKELGEHMGLPQHRYRWRVAEARIRQVEQDLDGALALLDEANHVYVGDYSPNVRPVPALRARVHVARGDLDSADAWARDSGVAVDDDPNYLREFEHLTLARVLLARYASEQEERLLVDAVRLLGRLLPAAEQGGRAPSVIEILLVQAIAHHLRGDVASALDCLPRAVALAEPEGYVRLFADEGPPLASMLRALTKQAAAPRYVGRLLAAMGDTALAGPGQQALVDPLSDRELEVLRLLGTDLSGPDIARELVVSLNTVRTHTKHIYTKLGVSNRRAAVRQGERLNLP